MKTATLLAATALIIPAVTCAGAKPIRKSKMHEHEPVHAHVSAPAGAPTTEPEHKSKTNEHVPAPAPVGTGPNPPNADQLLQAVADFIRIDLFKDLGLAEPSAVYNADGSNLSDSLVRLTEQLNRARSQGILRTERGESNKGQASASAVPPIKRSIGDGEMRTGVTEGGLSGFTRRSVPKLDYGDRRCSIRPERMREILQDINQDEMQWMGEWLQCPGQVQDEAIRAFLEIAPVETIILFFKYQQQDAKETAKLLGAARPQFTFDAIMARPDHTGEGVADLMEFFEGFGLFEGGANASLMPAFCSRLLVKAIESEVYLATGAAAKADTNTNTAKAKMQWTRRSKMFYLAQRIILDGGITHLPSVLVDGFLAHPIHGALKHFSLLGSDYFELVLPRTDSKDRFRVTHENGFSLDVDFCSFAYVFESDPAFSEIVRRCEERYYAQNPKLLLSKQRYEAELLRDGQKS